VTQCTPKSAMARAQGGMTAGIKYAGDIITGRHGVTSWLLSPDPDVIRMRTVHSYSATEAHRTVLNT
jgi:hypothetical protein